MKDKFLLIFILFIFSCNSDKKDILSLNTFPENSSESFLLSTNDNLYISWTEQVADSNFLYLSKLEDNTWSEKSIIKKGTDWFVNWADFPSISYNDISSSIFSFHLQKSSEETFSYDVNYHFNTVISL